MNELVKALNDPTTIREIVDIYYENSILKKENELLKEELKELKEGITSLYNNMIALETINKYENDDIEEI